MIANRRQKMSGMSRALGSQHVPSCMCHGQTLDLHVLISGWSYHHLYSYGPKYQFLVLTSHPIYRMYLIP